MSLEVDLLRGLVFFRNWMRRLWLMPVLSTTLNWAHWRQKTLNWPPCWSQKNWHLKSNRLRYVCKWQIAVCRTVALGKCEPVGSVPHSQSQQSKEQGKGKERAFLDTGGPDPPPPWFTMTLREFPVPKVVHSLGKQAITCKKSSIQFSLPWYYFDWENNIGSDNTNAV